MVFPHFESIACRSRRLGRANGFDGLRLMLALAIVAVHGVTLTAGDASGMAWPFRSAAGLVLPAFFALSGYLVTASLMRCADTRAFLLLRLLRIVPALAATVAATALLLGPLMTALPLTDYFASPVTAAYLQNIIGLPHFLLPGLFEANPRAGIVNGSLWTIQMEMGCYLALALLALLARGRLFGLALLGLALMLLFPHLPFIGLALAWLPAKPLVLAFVCGALLQRCAARVPLHPVLGVAALAGAFWIMRDPADAGLAVPILAYGVIWLGLRRIPAALTRADYSYGLYLTAYPLQQAAIQFVPGQSWGVNMALALPVAFLAAAALWHGVERPLMARKHEIVARLTGRPLGLRWVRA
jgi:peptidoglycan/LPS O-acetylase OafA/YrhL